VGHSRRRRNRHCARVRGREGGRRSGRGAGTLAQSSRMISNSGGREVASGAHRSCAPRTCADQRSDWNAARTSVATSSGLLPGGEVATPVDLVEVREVRVDRLDTASTAAATANSTARCSASRSRKAASTHQLAPTSNANKTKARAAAKRSAASNANSPAPSTPRSKQSQD
jgi:hypothetical protein